MKAWPIVLAGFAALSAAGYKASDVRPIVDPPDSADSLAAHEASASSTLVGQFRTSITAWLWVRTDLYLHNGIEMRKKTQAEEAAGLESETPHEDHELEHHYEHDIVTVIPSKERDFRGIFGDVERAVSAYKPMHDHTHNDPQKSLPLFRLMTWLDPEFVPGWTTGASVMIRNPSPESVEQTWAFLADGLRHNPNSVAILKEQAQLVIRKKGDLQKGRALLEQALKVASDESIELSIDDRESLEDVYRWLALCHRDLGNRPAMRATAWQGLKAFPDDSILAHMAVDPPTIVTEETREAMIDQAMAWAAAQPRPRGGAHGDEP